MDLYKVAKMQQVWVRDIAICSEKPSPAETHNAHQKYVDADRRPLRAS